MIFSFSIRSGDGSAREHLGSMSLHNDHAALAFGDNVIRDMLPDTAARYSGWTMDIVEGTGCRSGEPGERPARPVCSIAFP
jgi:hypothetical protein